MLYNGLKCYVALQIVLISYNLNLNNKLIHKSHCDRVSYLCEEQLVRHRNVPPLQWSVVPDPCSGGSFPQTPTVEDHPSWTAVAPRLGRSTRSQSRSRTSPAPPTRTKQTTTIYIIILHCNASLNGYNGQIYGAERNAVLIIIIIIKYSVY